MNHDETLTNSELPENIDETQWVKWDNRIGKDGKPIDPMVKPERAAKGDMNIIYSTTESGEILGIRLAQAQVRNVLNFLWERDIITDEQHDYGNVFWAWRNQHRVALGMEKPISGQLATSTSVKLRAYGYILLVKRLSLPDYQVIDQAIESFESEYTRFFALQRREIYRRAFGRLGEIVPPIRERIAYLEALSEEEREVLSEEHMKKYLATIIKNA